ncbi:MAG TPA: M20/M25/M40 family metallo-hydrolase, partial [Planctomycetota bacterium]|nr:M20/M25/M40 family metallo-hydrolase [Planctomycetota bacterium]
MLAALALLALTPQDKTDWDAEGRACADLLKEMIRIDTINPPQDASKKNANETELCRRVQALLKKDGIESEILEPEPGRGSLIARLKGSGAKKPVLLMAHIDVVGVDRGKWTVDPVAAMEKDGIIYGRGAIDDKGMAAVITHVFRMLKRRGEKLSRDVILMLNADEESGGHQGAKWVVDRHFEKVDAEFVINEGGRIGLKDGKLTQVGVQCAEKVYNDVRLWMRGTSGHSSVPRPDNAIYNLSAALEKLKGFQTPLRVTDVAKA